MSYALEFSRDGQRWLRVPETLRSSGRRYLERQSHRAIEIEARFAKETWRTPHVRIIDLYAPSAPIIAPAETIQAEETPAPRARRPLLWALWVVTIALVGAHPLWVRAGMPVPAFLSPIMEMMHV